MPVIVIGADTPTGRTVIDRLLAPGREVRAFVSDQTEGDRLKKRGVKVALGDVSDASHVEGACTSCFSAVLVADAAHDARERAFATGGDVLVGWAEALVAARVRRAIWVTNGFVPPPFPPEQAIVDAALSQNEIADHVARLDDSERLP